MINIILDCDPGHDDAIAIMLAGSCKLINILGITTVAGNQTIDKVTLNALHIVEFLKLKVDVYKGSTRAIMNETIPAPKIHGESGLDGYEFPNPKMKAKNGAVNFIIETILKSKNKITMVTTGPMTNLALALLINPDIKNNIHSVVMMGGAIGEGNVTPAAEYNIHEDPEAAYIIFKSGVPVYMIGLDVTRKVLALPNIIERMSKINNRVSDMFCKLMVTYNQNQKKTFGLEGGPLHDPCTIAYLIDDDLIKFKHLNTEIDITNGPSRGRTNCDFATYNQKEPNSFVAVDINVDRFWDIIEESIKSYR